MAQFFDKIHERNFMLTTLATEKSESTYEKTTGVFLYDKTLRPPSFINVGVNSVKLWLEFWALGFTL